MTASEWAESSNPKALFAFLRDQPALRSRRLYRRVAAACCERLLSALGRSREWHHTAELLLRRLLDRPDDPPILGQRRRFEQAPLGRAVRERAMQGDQPPFCEEDFLRSSERGDPGVRAFLDLDRVGNDPADAARVAWLAAHAVAWVASEARRRRVGWTWGAAEAEAESAFRNAFAAECRAQASLIRCVFGRAFNRLAIEGPVLAWNGGTVARVAETIYESCNWGELPILADALEDAGFNDEGALGHLRGAGPHARGCYVIGAVVGKY